MATEVAIYKIEGHRRSTMCCEAMHLGIRSTGDRPATISTHAYTKPMFPVAVFYGYDQILRQIMADYVAAGLHAVYIDLGYWQREGMTGHHKIVVNDRHPTKYFQRVKHSSERAQSCHVRLRDYQSTGRHILLAGMGPKAAEAEGKQPLKWESDAVEALRMFTDREIVYRPKPSWIGAPPLKGTRFSPKAERLEDVLRNCHAVVTHHSNVAVEGLVAGVPAFCWKGVAQPMALQDLKEIEAPFYPFERGQWVNDIAYTQWNVDEMKRGLPWRHLKNEGLIP
jgi:hypothetical protein